MILLKTSELATIVSVSCISPFFIALVGSNLFDFN